MVEPPGHVPGELADTGAQADAVSAAMVQAGLLAPEDQRRAREIVRFELDAGASAPGPAAGPIRLDPPRRRALVRGRTVSFTKVEFALLAFFVAHPKVVFERAELLERVWGYTTGSTATVTVHIRRLRSKIEEDPMRPVLLKTLWGSGYVLDVPSTVTDGAEPA